MNRLRTALLAVVCFLGVMGAGGCLEDDETVTCSNFDSFLYECYYNCAPTFHCEDRYAALDAISQQLLLDCSECLQQQALVEDCSDCVVEGWSCKDLMLDLLEGECQW